MDEQKKQPYNKDHLQPKMKILKLIKNQEAA